MSNHTANNNCSNSFILNTETLYGYETGECHIVKIKETEKNLKIPESSLGSKKVAENEGQSHAYSKWFS